MAKRLCKLDPLKVRKLKGQGLSNSQIAQRLGVTQGAIYHVLRKYNAHETDANVPRQGTNRLASDLL